MITGHPGGAAAAAADRRGPSAAAGRRGRRPSGSARGPSGSSRWAFALGLLLILIAISTADAATL